MLSHEAVKTTNMFSSLTKTSSLDSSSTSTASTPTSSGGGAPKKKSKSKNKTKNKKKTNKADQSENRAAAANGGADAHEDASQLPLTRRLEVAAAIPDTHAALVGLLGWSRLYVHTETILASFQSDALSLLLSNVLCSRPAAAVLANLEALLANCLSVESEAAEGSAPHRQMAGEVVAAVRAIADQLQDAAEDVDAEAERAARSLSRLVCAHALSLHGVELHSPLTKDVQDLEAKIAAVTSADEAVRGQTMRESFQRRDLRSEALALHDTRLKTLTKLVEERVQSSEQQREVEDEVEEEEDNESPEDDSQIAQDETAMQEVTKALQDMQDRKDTELAPLRSKKAAASAEVQALRQKQEELEDQLRAVKSELERVVGEQYQADEGMRAVEERFIADTARFRAEHQHVARRFSRAQRRRVITTEVSRVENEVRQARLAHSQVHALRAKQTSCMAQQLEASLNYFESELPCVKFMMSRVEENEAQLTAARSEAASYRALGVSAVAEELEEKVAGLEAHVEEDKNCLSALRKRDEELLSSMRRILTDSSLREALTGVEEKIKHESQRMIDYVSKLYEESASHTTESAASGFESNGAMGSKTK